MSRFSAQPKTCWKSPVRAELIGALASVYTHVARGVRVVVATLLSASACGSSCKSCRPTESTFQPQLPWPPQSNRVKGWASTQARLAAGSSVAGSDAGGAGKLEAAAAAAAATGLGRDGRGAERRPGDGDVSASALSKQERDLSGADPKEACGGILTLRGGFHHPRLTLGGFKTSAPEQPASLRHWQTSSSVQARGTPVTFQATGQASACPSNTPDTETGTVPLPQSKRPLFGASELEELVRPG